MIDDQVAFAAIKRFGECESGFGLTDARRSDEQEHADRPFRIGQTGTRRADTLGDSLEGVILTETVAKRVGQIQNSIDLVGDHLADRNTRPAGDDFSDGLAVHDRLHQRIFALYLFKLFIQPFQLGSSETPCRRFRAVAIGAAAASASPTAVSAADVQLRLPAAFACRSMH